MIKKIDQLLQVTTDFWNLKVKEITRSLAQAYPMSSGRTAQMIGSFNPSPVSISTNGINIDIYMPNYYDFMDKGVSGALQNTNRSIYRYKNKKPPIKAIRQFMLNRGIVGQNYRKMRSMPKGKNRDNSIEKELNKIAYAISYSIWKRGLIGTQFYSKVINDEAILAFEQMILKEYGELIIDIVNEKI